jgi:hypothetical protein
MTKKKYMVNFVVYETIRQEVETEETDEDIIRDLAIELAVEEQPKVYWEVDTDSEIEVNEIE